ncbi:bifunctional DNA primase/polymerase [Chloroflexota bacterium]
MNSVFETVQALRNLGYSVVPSKGKHPLVKWKPYQERLPTDAEHKSWRNNLKPELYGVITGKLSGVVVVDCDSPEAMQVMVDLKLHIRTPRNGGHYYFTYPGYPVKTMAGILLNIDIRGDGGYVNAVGTTSKGEYKVEIMPTPDTIYSWDQMPAAIMEKMAGNESESVPTIETEPSTIITEGKRNATFASLAGTMQHRGMPLEAIEAALLTVNRLQCQPPLEEKEVLSITKSVGRYETTQIDKKDKKRLNVTTQLLEMTKDIELFHTPDKRPFAIIKQNSHTETWPLESRTVKDFLARCYHEETGDALSSQTIQNALNVLRSRALFAGPEEPVYTRVAGYNGKIYLDLCNPTWDVVEITDQGWEVIQSSPVHFVRGRGMTALPEPKLGGHMAELGAFLNATSSDWPLILGWLVGTFLPSGPYPVLVLTGEQGSAKSTVAKMIRSLVDPSTSPLRSLPREERDLAISAHNSRVIAFDNVSYLKPWLSDALCRLATGGGFATRELYADSEEVLFSATRPIILNGIGDIATRSDLMDRAIIIVLPNISNDKRRTEADLWEEFKMVTPIFLASLLDAVSLGLGYVNTVKLDGMPRMADFAKWVVAAIPALGVPPNDFLDAYGGNIQDVNELALESTPVAKAILIMASEIPEGGEWEGNATLLLERLSLEVGDIEQRQRNWPKNARALGAILSRLAPNLRAVGLDITRFRGGGERLIHIRKGVQKYVTPAKHEKLCTVRKLESGGLSIHLRM